MLELIHCQQLLDIRSIFPADAAVVNTSAPLWPSVAPKTPLWNNGERDIDSLEDPWHVGSRLVDEESDWHSIPNNDVYSAFVAFHYSQINVLRRCRRRLVR